MIKTVILAALALAALSSPAAAFLERVVVAEMHPETPRDALQWMVDDAAAAAGVPARIAHAVIRQESNYNPRLRGRAGEWGIGQIKCATARSVGFRGGCGQLADAATNLTVAFAYLRIAIDRGGTGCAGVSLYQRGVYGRPTCTSYGRQVMARAGRR